MVSNFLNLYFPDDIWYGVFFPMLIFHLLWASAPYTMRSISSLMRYQLRCLTHFFFKILFIFPQRGEGRERRKHQCVVVSHATSTRDLVRNPGICPDWESDQPPFGLQADAQSTELHQPGLAHFFNRAVCLLMSFKSSLYILDSSLLLSSIFCR